MSDDEVRTVAVHPAIWPQLELFAWSQGCRLIAAPIGEDGELAYTFSPIGGISG